MNGPYLKKYIFQVRHQISSIMATVLSLDIDYGEDGLNMGNGYPGLSDLLEFIMPKLKINFHNPSLNGHSIRQQNGNVQDHDENSSRYVLLISSSVIKIFLDLILKFIKTAWHQIRIKTIFFTGIMALSIVFKISCYFNFFFLEKVRNTAVPGYYVRFQLVWFY